jgi:Ca2+-binding EF-hand superfamily protein
MNSDEKESEYKELFEMFDKDEDGLIDQNDLGKILRALGQDPSDQDLIEMITDVDKNEDKLIDYEEFLQLVDNKEKDNEAEKELIEAFLIFDREGNGLISNNEFKHIMLSLGEKLSEEEIEQMIKIGDPKQEGFINYKQFVEKIIN